MTEATSLAIPYRPTGTDFAFAASTASMLLLAMATSVAVRSHMSVWMSPGSTEFTSTLSAPYFFDRAFPVAIMADLVAA